MVQLSPRSKPLPNPTPDSETFDAALSLMPYLTGDLVAVKKGHYLCYRYTGFNVKEACEALDISLGNVYNWRKLDPQFKQLEEEAAGPRRKEFRREVLHMLYVRNYHLVLRKDWAVLRRANGMDKNVVGEILRLSKSDEAYLNRLRQHYTPQQFEAIEQLLTSTHGDGEFDFTKMLLNMARRKVEVKVTEERTYETNPSHTQTSDNQDSWDEEQPQ